MDGVLIVDKPQGVTSHDVVAVARRALGERRIGHAGTLDPLATGVLALACGRATRLIRFLTASDKDYDAVIRFGITTDSYDITGRETSQSGLTPTRDAVERGLDALRGEYLQMPPAFSAKKIGGERAYTLARRSEEVALRPVPVRVARADLIEFAGTTARVTLTCSAGFYVRAFAHSLGEIVRTGACLESLRRTRSGDFSVATAVTMDVLQDARREWKSSVVPLERLLVAFPAAMLTDEGRGRVAHGQHVQQKHLLSSSADISACEGCSAWVRLLDADGRLLGVATAEPGSGSLHPAVVLI